MYKGLFINHVIQSGGNPKADKGGGRGLEWSEKDDIIYKQPLIIDTYSNYIAFIT